MPPQRRLQRRTAALEARGSGEDEARADQSPMDVDADAQEPPHEPPRDNQVQGHVVSHEQQSLPQQDGMSVCYCMNSR